jgi:hypothetical protein
MSLQSRRQHSFIILFALLSSLYGLNACKSRDASSLRNRPDRSGDGSEPTWKKSEKEGKFLDCKSDAAMKKDYLSQLQQHMVYGDLNKIRTSDPVAADMASYYRQNLKAMGIETNTFESIKENQLLDGAKGFKFVVDGNTIALERGDILLNFSFGQPDRPGYFYSKRGMTHARLVVGYDPTGKLLTFDGGWEEFSSLTQMNSQTIWLRPKAKYINAKDVENIVKWSKLMETLPYDNTLTDDWADYRKELHKLLDDGKDHLSARTTALSVARAKGFAPKASPDTYLPESGIYCSEGAAAIYSYLGFRMHGETAFDIIGKFSRTGDLPDWAAYADALSGFGADSDPNTFMMHNLFYSYFSFFDSARKGLISLPEGVGGSDAGFAGAMKANVLAAMKDGGASDLLAKQLDEVIAKLPSDSEGQIKIKKLKEALSMVANNIGSLAKATNFNITKAIYFVFFSNQSYGPHAFFENGKYFDLVGVFYNSDLTSGYQAKWVSDWWVAPHGKPRLSGNISTTLYRVAPERSELPDDRCVAAEEAPIIRTR